ncbi:hypothetical protein AB0C96_41050 [Streptomyces sp. NPDC048506]|uniref:hypothetical protein n=1 Tax=Streptomyces sp. NPDC048506 TaxID=3155028 RepID=UPI00342420C1
MRRRTKIGTTVAGVIAALAVAGSVAPAAHAADDDEAKCQANIYANATAQIGYVQELVHEIQERQPPQVVEAAEIRLNEERAQGQLMRELARYGRWGECARV